MLSIWRNIRICINTTGIWVNYERKYLHPLYGQNYFFIFFMLKNFKLTYEI